MKTTLSILALSLLTSWSLVAQGSIKGSGPIVKKAIEVSAFEGIKLAFSGNVVLRPGAQQMVEVQGQENLIDNISTKVDGKVWDIEFKANRVTNMKELTVFITVPKLTSIAISGSGDIRTEGTFDSSNTMDVALSGSGDLELNAKVDKMNVAISGSGDVRLAGSASENNLSVTGSGDISAFDFSAQAVNVSIVGSGDCKVQVANELNVSILGSGDVHYKGNPGRVKQNIMGSGEVYNK